MFKKFTRKAATAVITLSMLAGCTTPIPLSSATENATQWVISPQINSQKTKSEDKKPVKASIKSEKERDLPKDSTSTDKVQSSIAAAIPDIQSGDAAEFLKDQAINKAHAIVEDTAENWLSQFGTAKLSIGRFDDSKNYSGSLDFLVPVIDDDKSLAYVQLGARRSNQYTDSFRTTINAGAGYRQFFDAKYPYMLGLNGFYDQDLTVGHQRLGLGSELWFDNLKFAVNAYLPLSSWKKSPDLNHYLERSAKGFDIRAEGFLPMYPQLGGKLMYEQYFGDEVGLFGTHNRQRNPYAYTAGISYTPVPAISLSVDHKRGADGLHSTNAMINFKYEFGVPLAKQLDASRIAASRKLDGMKYDLVDRNNKIVSSYNKEKTSTEQDIFDIFVIDLSAEWYNNFFDSPFNPHLYARVTDSNGNNVGSGVVVTWSGGTTNSTSITDSNGIASIVTERVPRPAGTPDDYKEDIEYTASTVNGGLSTISIRYSISG